MCIRAFALSGVLAVAAATSAVAQTSPPSTVGALLNVCASALHVDTSDIQTDDKLRYALQMIASSDKTSSDTQKWATSALTAYGFFKGGMDSAKSQASKLYDSSDENLQYEAAASVVTSSLSAAGSQSFNNCVNKVLQSGGIDVLLQEQDVSGFTVLVSFRPMRGVIHPSLVVRSDANLDGNRSKYLSPAGSDRALIFTRDNPTKASRVEIDVQQGQDTLQAVSIYVPPYAVIRQATTTVTMSDGPKEIICGGHRHYGTWTGPTLTVAAGPNQTLDKDHVVFKRLPQIAQDISRLDSPGNWVELDKSSDARSIVAQMQCTSPWAGDNFYHSTAKMDVPVNTTTTTYSMPPDNGHQPVLKLENGAAAELRDWAKTL